jgi:hypothetical protein
MLLTQEDVAMTVEEIAHPYREARPTPPSQKWTADADRLPQEKGFQPDGEIGSIDFVEPIRWPRVFPGL